jgi:HAE1 family hydrophobic/amphiphilic exporter-1
MSIYKKAVNNPITTAMVFVAIILFGLYSFSKLSVDLYPEMELPAISVLTTYPGSNAADIETNVTKTLENGLGSIANLKEISSTSQDNISVITMEFEWGTNLDEASNDIRDVIDRMVDFLPENCDRPSIFKFNTNMMPIMMFAITADQSYLGLEKMIDERVVNPLKRIDGIGNISLIGGPKRVVYIESDPQKLDAYNISIEQIGNAIRTENINLSSGNIRMGKEDYQLRVEGEFKESPQIQNIVVGAYNGKQIFLRDIATVRDTLKDASMDEKINGGDGMRLMITKQSGSNTVAIAKKVNAQLEQISKELPKDVKIQQIFDSSNFIKNSISGLSEALLYALIFVVLVILVFLGRWRATFIIVLTIPISLIVSFIYLYMTGSSINIISLSSLSIAIGMVVDDAIVVLENITKHIERGSSPREAAIYATNEGWLSVIVTTLVVVAVFLPLTMVSGMTGIMFKQLGFIVTITVVTSTLAAISLTPMLAGLMLRLRPQDIDKSKGGWYQRNIIPIFDKLDVFYENTLRWSLQHKIIIISSAIVIFFSSLFLLKFIGTGFMSETDEGRLSIAIELQRGTRVEETVKTARAIEAILNDIPEVELYSTSAGSDDEGGFASLFNSTGSNLINVTIRLKNKSERERDIWEISEFMRKKLANFPEIVNYTVTPNGGMMSMGGSNTVDVEIFGYDFDQTGRLAQEIKQKVSTLKGARDIVISRKEDKAELQVVFDREKLAALGLNSAMASTYVRNRIAGLTSSQLREDGDEYNIVVRLQEDARNSISKIEDLTFMTPSGKKVKLKEVGKVKELWSPPNIQHKRKERFITVSVKPVGVPLGVLAEQIKKEIKTIEKPKDVIVNVGGAYEDQQESFADIGLLMVMSLLLVFIVMASQFESFAKPFVIMLSIPFAFTGVFIALFFTGTELNMIAALGAVLLIGIVVKNGIVLVDFINLMRDRGLELNEAIAVSGKSRLRPVLMTALTTILGMLPMALSSSEGSEIWKPMGIAVVGGLTFSTIVTMIIVPVMYAVMARHGERDKQKKVREQFKFLDK